MDNKPFTWDAPTPSATDQLLIEAYQAIGVPLDALVYTPEFRALAERIGVDSKSEMELRELYLRLLGLRKRSLLPRLYETTSS